MALFGGVAIEDGAVSALTSTVMEGMIFPPNMLYAINSSRQMELDQAKLASLHPGRRIWFEISSEKPTSWISLNPGATTQVKPDGEDDLIIEHQPEFNSPLFERKILELTQKKGIGQQASVETDAAERIIAGQFDREEDLEPFCEVYKLNPGQARNWLAENLAQLFQTHFLGYRVSLSTFSLSLALLQLYMCGLGRVEDEGPFDDPVSSLRGVLRSAASNPNKKALQHFKKYLADTIQNIGHHKKNAIESTSLVEYHQQIYIAMHEQYTAMMLAHLTEESGIETPHTAHVLEEGWATMVEHFGLFENFYWNQPFFLSELWGNELTESYEASKSNLARANCSMFKAHMPRFLFESMFEYTALKNDMFSHLDATSVLDRFYGIEDSYSCDTIFGVGWFDHIVLNAAIELGVDEVAKQRATRIIGRMSVQRLLSS